MENKKLEPHGHSNGRNQRRQTTLYDRLSWARGGRNVVIILFCWRAYKFHYPVKCKRQKSQKTRNFYIIFRFLFYYNVFIPSFLLFSSRHFIIIVIIQNVSRLSWRTLKNVCKFDIHLLKVKPLSIGHFERRTQRNEFISIWESFVATHFIWPVQISCN